MSNIVNEVIKTISNQFIFLLRNIFEHTKSSKTQTNDFHPLRSLCAHKNFLILLFFVRLFLICLLVFACGVFLYAQNILVKKVNWLKIVLITSFTILLYPSQPLYQEFICTHLFLFVIICDNLFFL